MNIGGTTIEWNTLAIGVVAIAVVVLSFLLQRRAMRIASPAEQEQAAQNAFALYKGAIAGQDWKRVGDIYLLAKRNPRLAELIKAFNEQPWGRTQQ